MGLVGNDVVDLHDPQIQSHHQRDRFVRRVCTPDEVARVAAAADPKSELWALFAAKEAAFKALSKRQPGLAFSPRRFHVDSQWSDVRHDDVRMWLRIDRDADRVHAVAGQGAGEPHVQVERMAPAQHESDAVRALGVRLAAQVLDVEIGRLRIERSADPRYYRDLGPPELLLDGARCRLNVSLSHDGDWVACALLDRDESVA